ncbi:MAG: ribbon-helix-helix protein, CopG family [Selenomonas sp.]|jgi:metal-responsive CopG/Arc/MetJ family transcriptional regulator|nr:ribbon-helix-helix protein, CopG family [Selenomonas sp.]MCI7329901.1 ribbon-helix-helix protein, CopG family [Selenomonadaceae bacterium]MDD6120346.1 ribbon-helix-helix protein, CopG family [Selenomonadaceae bacterium]MDY3915867.1 ribbon-helix-helix protein, CopG family [Selenomonadaceae bacterium]HBT79568.1 CopG family transcriptional regulator [Selenomonas sp.]
MLTQEREQEYRKVFGVKLPEDLIDRIRARAEEENIPIRDLVERIFRTYLQEHPSRQGRLL